MWVYPLTYKGTLSEQINRFSDNDSGINRWLQGIFQDLIINAPYLEHLEEGAYAHLGDATIPRDVEIYACVLRY